MVFTSHNAEVVFRVLVAVLHLDHVTALGLVLSFARRKANSALTITALSLVAPFAAYLLGEVAHDLRGAGGGGHRARAGLPLAHRGAGVGQVDRDGDLGDPAVGVLEGAVFALIGLQLRSIVGSLDPAQDNVFVAITAVVATVIVSRRGYGLALIHLGCPDWGAPATRSAGEGAAVSWAGMRGVVSLAAAQSLPLETPQRSLLLVCTIAVIVGTLVLQGLSLPWVIRRLGIVKDHRADDEAGTRGCARPRRQAINDRVDSMCDDGQLSERQAVLMRKWAALRDWRNWDDDDKSREFGRRLGRAVGLAAVAAGHRAIGDRQHAQRR